jgi:purine-binding chemotaxis protein CheW
MTDALELRVRGLRAAFDRTFALAPSTDREPTEDLLLIRVGPAPYALRISELAGVAKDRPIVAAPSHRHELLGLAALRGEVLCVYSMAHLLGLSEETSAPPWIALSGGAEPVALAFARVEGFLRAARAAVHEDPGGRLVRAVLKEESLARPIVDLPAMLETVHGHAGTTGPIGRNL